jgi:hypothetical protein
MGRAKVLSHPLRVWWSGVLLLLLLLLLLLVETSCMGGGTGASAGGSAMTRGLSTVIHRDVQLASAAKCGICGDIVLVVDSGMGAGAGGDMVCGYVVPVFHRDVHDLSTAGMGDITDRFAWELSNKSTGRGWLWTLGTSWMVLFELAMNELTGTTTSRLDNQSTSNILTRDIPPSIKQQL